jgi:hypothetical protein
MGIGLGACVLAFVAAWAGVTAARDPPNVTVVRVDGMPCRLRSTEHHTTRRVVDLFCGAVRETAEGSDGFDALFARAKSAMSANPTFGEAQKKLVDSRSEPLPPPGRPRGAERPANAGVANNVEPDL